MLNNVIQETVLTSRLCIIIKNQIICMNTTEFIINPSSNRVHCQIEWQSEQVSCILGQLNSGKTEEVTALRNKEHVGKCQCSKPGSNASKTTLILV